MGEEKCVQGLVGKPEEKSPPGKPRPRLEDNIKIDLKCNWRRGLD
jgi:hypothetical protein